VTPVGPTPTPTPPGTIDLRLVSVQDPPASLSAGATLEVADATMKLWPRELQAVHARCYLSLDPGKGAGDVLLTLDAAAPAPAGR
jgi:hypothetical protein